MAGMKIRSTIIRNLASNKAKGAISGLLLLSLAFAVPRLDYAQDKPSNAGVAVPVKGNVIGNSAEAQTGAITDVKVAPDDGTLTVAVTTDRSIEPKELILDNPPRLVLDFLNTENKVKFSKLPVLSASVKQVRVQQFQGAPSPIARVVCDLEEDYGTHEINFDKSAVRLVFHKEAPKTLPASSGPVVKPASSPVQASDVKPRPAESVAKNPPAPAPAVSPERARPQAEAPKAASVAELKSRPAETAGKSAAAPAVSPAPAPPQAETPKVVATVAEQKPRAAEPAVKNPQAPAPHPRQESSKAVAASQVSKPHQAAPAAKDSVDTAPLVAALAPAPISTPKMAAAASSSSRYTGQPLTLDLVNMPLVDFFRLMQEEGGINIVVDPDVKGNYTIKGEKIPWDQVFEMALISNGLDKQIEGNVIRVTRKATLQTEAKQREDLKKANLLAADLETRIKRLNYAKAAIIAKSLADQKTVRGTMVVDERTNSLILTDLPSALDRVLSLVETLDIPQPQVEIEARIVSASRNFARDIGIQFGFVDGNLQRVTVGGPNTFGTIGGTRPSTTPNSTYAAGNSSTGRGASDSKSTESGAISTGTGSQQKGNYNVNLPANKAFGGIGLSVGNIFDTFLLDAAITAGEQKGWAKLISQPKVVAQNNSPAIINQGLRFPVQIVSNNTVTVQFENAALTLTVTPQITYDGNIVLDLKVENNTPNWDRTVNNIPSINTSESTTRVLVSDGGTTVIGGILLDQESKSEDRVPGLASLPVIGNLFRRTSVSRDTREVLFFVTPRIVK
jgi:type IV pilus secretin PilQ/predicted competence protein